MDEQLAVVIQAQVNEAVDNLSKFASTMDGLAEKANYDAGIIERAFKGIKDPDLRSKFLGGFHDGLKDAEGAVTNAASSMRGALSNAVPGGELGLQFASLAGGAGLAAIGVGALGAGLVAGAVSAAHLADELGDTAQNLGITTTYLQTMNGVATKFGSDGEKMANALGKLNIKIGEAANGNKEAKGAFDALGVSVKDANGHVKTQEQVFAESRDALSKVENASQRAALSTALFGKGAKEIQGVLGASKSDYDAVVKNIQDYSVASESAIAAAGGFQDSMDIMGQTVQAGTIEAFAPLAEILSKLSDAVIPYVAKAFDVIGGTIRVVITVVEALWDMLQPVLKVIWDLGVSIVQTAAKFSPFTIIMRAVGKTAGDMGVTFAGVMNTMGNIAATVVGGVVKYLTMMVVTFENVMARINNAVANTTAGKALGFTPQQIKDARAEGEKAGTAVADGIRAGYAKLGSIGAGMFTRDKTSTQSEASGEAKDPTESGKKGKGQDKAAEEAKKYAAVLADLKKRIDEVGRSEQEKLLIDEFVKAGLPADINLHNQKADAIRALVTELGKATEQANVTKALAQYDQKIKDLSLSEDELKVREELRRIGVKDDVALDDKRIAQLVAQIRHYQDLAKAKKAADEGAKKIEDAKAKLQGAQDAVADKQKVIGGADPELIAIQRRLEARQREIDLMLKKGEITAQQAGELEVLAQQTAEQEKINNQLDKSNELSKKMAGFMVDMFKDPQAALKQLFEQLMTELLQAILRATILKALMPGGGGGGGGIGGIFAGLFGGGRASGGSIDAGKAYLVGENGPEIIAASNSARVFTNRDSFGGGGRAVSITTGPTTIHLQSANQQDRMALQQQMILQERQQRAMIRDELRKAGVHR